VTQTRVGSSSAQLAILPPKSLNQAIYRINLSIQPTPIQLTGLSIVPYIYHNEEEE